MSRPRSQPGRPAKDDRAISIECPFKVICDSREQSVYRFAGLADDADDVEADPYTFDGLQADSHQKYAPLAVQTIRTGLPRGDYAVAGLEGLVIERKSLQDLYGSVGRRENFEHRLSEMTRLERIGFVVVEAPIEVVASSPPPFTKLHPKALIRTIQAWETRFPFVHWKFMPDRAWAEAYTFRLLERWYRDHKLDMKDVTVLDQATGKLVRSIPSPLDEVIPPADGSPKKARKSRKPSDQIG